MNIKKILVTSFLAVATLVSTVGCTSLTVEEIFSESMQKVTDAKFSDMSLSINMKFSSSTEEMEVAMDTDIMIDATDDSNIKLSNISTTSMMGMEIPITVYYLDGYQYMDMMDQKVKMEMTIEEYFTANPTVSYASQIESFSEYNMEEVDDNYVISYVVSEEKSQEVFLQSLGGMEELLMADIGEADITFNSIIGENIIDKDYNLKEQNMTIDVNITVEGESVDMLIETKAVINEIAETGEIVFPDFSEYIEIDASELGVG